MHTILYMFHQNQIITHYYSAALNKTIISVKGTWIGNQENLFNWYFLIVKKIAKY